MEEQIRFTHKLPSMKKFKKRLFGGFFYGLLIVSFSLFVGIIGYRTLAELSWIDSFLNASMILSGMGPVAQLTEDDAKLFAGIYSLFSGVMFLTGIAVFIAPIAHRMIHVFHIKDVEDIEDIEDKEDKEDHADTPNKPSA